MNEEVKLQVLRHNLQQIHPILEKASKKPRLFLTLKRTYELLNMTNLGYFSHTIERSLGDLVDGFIFESLSDAIVARHLGVKKRIILLYYVSYEEAVQAAKLDIEITCSDSTWLTGLLQMAPVSQLFKVHVYYDVGIGRQGLINETELEELIHTITKTPQLQLCGVGTRFNPNTNGLQLNEGLWNLYGIPLDVRRATMHGYIAEQKLRFGSFVDKIRTQYSDIEVHAACSKEIINDQTDIFYDFVRVGILALSTLMTPVSLYVPVLSIKELPANFCIGYYGLSGQTTHLTRVAYIKFYKFLHAKYYYNGEELSPLKVSDPFGLIIDENSDIHIGSMIEICPTILHYQ